MMACRALLLLVFIVTLSVSAEAKLRSLPEAKPGWAKASSLARDAPLGHAIHFAIHLPWRNRYQLESFARRVSDPSSSVYGNYLEPAEFRAKYSPSEADTEGVKSWLIQHDFSIVEVAGSGKFVIAEGTVGAASKAFNTRFGLYKVGKRTLRAPKTTPAVPHLLGDVVVVGLAQTSVEPYFRHRPRQAKPRVPVDAKAQASSAASRVPRCTWKAATEAGGDVTLPDCGYVPSQIRGVYGVPAALDGTGQTIAIIDAYASPFTQNDLTLWSLNRGIKTQLFTQLYPNYTYTVKEVLLNPSPGYSPTWAAEESLDVEAVHGIAPGVKIIYLGAASAYDVDLQAALAFVVDNKLASLISNSYGRHLAIPSLSFTAADIRRENQPFTDIFIQAAAFGIGVYFSSGDNGDNSIDTDTGDKLPATTEYPTSDPWAISVGGTTLGVSTKNTRLFEGYWGTWSDGGVTWTGGGGGGVSQIYPVPSYQKTGPAAKFLKAYGKGKSARVIPDVAAFGDPYTGFAVGYSVIEFSDDTPDGFGFGPKFGDQRQMGGTSLSCPTFVSLMALAQQQRPSKKPYGFINPLLYNLTAAAFYDVKTPAAKVTSGFEFLLFSKTQPKILVEPGYDSGTGLGSPTAALFAELKLH